MASEQSATGTYRAECVCGWAIERDARASNLPRENNEEIVRKVAEIHEERPRFGESADETHVTDISETNQEEGRQ